MAPVFRDQNIENRKFKTFGIIKKQSFKRHYVKSMSITYIINVLSKIIDVKANVSIIREKLVGNWNFFADFILRQGRSKCNVEIGDSSTDKIYNKIIQYCR